MAFWHFCYMEDAILFSNNAIGMSGPACGSILVVPPLRIQDITPFFEGLEVLFLP